jgi:hypothetical protein
MLSLAKQGSFRGEAAFSVQIFPWETEFMNNALWSPRGAQAGERTRTAGGTPSNFSARLVGCLTLRIHSRILEFYILI